MAGVVFGNPALTCPKIPFQCRLKHPQLPEEAFLGSLAGHLRVQPNTIVRKGRFGGDICV
jgi:hypothetical protein